MALLGNISRRIFLIAILQRNAGISCRLVSTTGKKEESDKACNSQEIVYKKIPDFSKPQENKNWISYGFSETDKGEDRFTAHLMLFTFFTVLICGFTFLAVYLPDKKRMDWARREAFIRLHEREQLGLDPVDRNYVDPEKIVLPPDEELREEDIVV